jgi:hypothetical protein
MWSPPSEVSAQILTSRTTPVIYLLIDRLRQRGAPEATPAE